MIHENFRVKSHFTPACRFMDAKSNKVKKKDNIELKFQSDKWKRPIAIKFSKLEPMKKWLEILCEKEVEFTPQEISIKFDGDHVEKDQSPLELDFEGGEIIDCLIKS